MYELKVNDPDGRHGKQGIVLCHYAMRVWNKSHHGNFMLYGHSHGSLADDPNSMSFDVGGNPTIELGDPVTITDLYTSKIYNIISQQLNFGGGLGMTIKGRV